MWLIWSFPRYSHPKERAAAPEFNSKGALHISGGTERQQIAPNGSFPSRVNWVVGSTMALAASGTFLE